MGVAIFIKNESEFVSRQVKSGNQSSKFRLDYYAQQKMKVFIQLNVSRHAQNSHKILLFPAEKLATICVD